ncbi:MAG: hypothetical protein IJ353_05020 [Lachnospiraceae bacterium]|nr:hypothetical protein [Lachnospiraceae bacterium]
MEELIERDLLCHSLNQHLRQGLCKGDEKMNCAMTGLNPYSFMKGFEYGMQLAQTIVCNRPTTTEAEIRAKAIDEFAEKLLEEVEANPVDVGGRYSYMIPQSFLEGQIKDIAEQLKEE